ncbi:MAG: adenosylhomocysteinase [Thermoproteota archaeon]|nr:adenosylhomocysteinase [Thermoproteota archaeon]
MSHHSQIVPGKIADSNLADKGRRSYEWAASRMGIVEKIRAMNESSQLLVGFRLSFCLHITKETSVLVMAAKSLGADIAICSANPLSAQDDIAAFLYNKDVNVYAWRGETELEYQQCIRNVLSFTPVIVTDDGGDLHSMAHQQKSKGIAGGTEETTSGVKRLVALERASRLLYPVIAVNNARTKYLFDNRHGTGQSTLDGILRSTGILLAGKNVVVCGYGWVGKGVATRAKGMGSIVTVTEVDPIKAIEAKMDGFAVMGMSDAAPAGDVFITCTGQTCVIRKEHFLKMKDAVILANAGHFDVEIDTESLYDISCCQPVQVSPNIERFDVNGKRLFLLSKGRVVNLVAAEGHPPEVMALSFANQLLSILYIAKNHDRMEVKVHSVPEQIDQDVGSYALDSMGIRIDKMIEEQERYEHSS